jgi:hypothetical protein
MLHRSIVLAALLVGVLPLSAQVTQGGALGVPLPLFPPNNWWNVDVSAAPLDPSSAAYINFIKADDPTPEEPTHQDPMHPDFGGDAEDGDVYGIPYIVVDGTQPKKTVTFDYWDESDGVDFETETSFPFYPIPDEAITMNGWIEGGQPGNVDQGGDRHILIVDRTNNHLYELYDMFYNGSAWEGGSGAFFDMNTNDRRPEGWTSADAAGLAILPGLVRYDEVHGDDEIRHAFRVTVRATDGHVYPASHTAGDTPGALPMGARLRLKQSKDISSYPAEIQRIFRAMKKYGLIVADNGSDLYVSGTYDTRWDNDILNPAFHSLVPTDFEVIQLGWTPSVSLVLTLPGNVGANDAVTGTITAYDVDSDVVTGYTGTVKLTSTDGAATLPLDYTFTTGDAGVHTFPAGFILRTPGNHVVTVKDGANATITGSAAVVVGPATPASLTATATTPTQVALSWSASTGAAEYEVVRRSATSGYATLTTTAGIAFTDTTAVANASYVYKVRAIDSADRASGFSTPDVATTMFFTNDPAVAGSTIAQATHVAQLRQAVNALRATAGLTAASFTDPTLNTSVKVKAAHFLELRTAIAAARTSLELPAVAFTDPSLAAVLVKAVHLQQLRDGVK